MTQHTQTVRTDGVNTKYMRKGEDISEYLNRIHQQAVTKVVSCAPLLEQAAFHADSVLRRSGLTYSESELHDVMTLTDIIVNKLDTYIKLPKDVMQDYRYKLQELIRPYFQRMLLAIGMQFGGTFDHPQETACLASITLITEMLDKTYRIGCEGLGKYKHHTRPIVKEAFKFIPLLDKHVIRLQEEIEPKTKDFSMRANEDVEEKLMTIINELYQSDIPAQALDYALAENGITQPKQ